MKFISHHSFFLRTFTVYRFIFFFSRIHGTLVYSFLYICLFVSFVYGVFSDANIDDDDDVQFQSKKNGRPHIISGSIFSTFQHCITFFSFSLVHYSFRSIAFFLLVSEFCLACFIHSFIFFSIITNILCLLLLQCDHS